MGTEYRRGIPSVAHIEAATRLGLEWEQTGRRWRETNSYRPIRPDGTPVDWNVLDAEAARVQGPIVGTVLGVNASGTVQVRLNPDDTVSPAAPAQAGPQCEECEGSGRIYGATHDGSRTCGECSGRGYMLPPRAPAAQPRRHGGIEPRRFADVRPDRHGWRWWRIAEYGAGRFEALGRQGFVRWLYDEETPGQWFTPTTLSRENVVPTDEQGNPVSWESIAQPVPTIASTQSQGFRADLWQRICAYLVNGATSMGCGLRDVSSLDAMGFRVQSPFFDAEILWPQGANHTDILTRWAVYQDLKPLYDIVDGAQGEAPMPEDVEAAWATAANPSYQRPQLGYCRLGRNSETLYLISSSGLRWLPREAPYGIPLRNFAAVLDAVAEQRVRAAASASLAMPTQYVLIDAASVRVTLNGEPLPLLPLTTPSSTPKTAPESTTLPRFTADELDDVDHSQSTKLDSAPLMRGKLPTAEQIGKYREVMAKRNSTVAEALKASGIDCEVAQYVLERWAGGLSDKEALWTIIAAEGVGTLASSIDRATIDERVRRARKPALDTSEPTDDTARRQREEREAQRLRMATLQAQLAAERAARTIEPHPEPNRFDLLECDPKADPAVSIAAWEARQKRSTVRPMPMPEPQLQPHLPFEIVDAEAEGLRPGAVFTALLGRALNPNC